MKPSERVYRELLHRALELKKYTLTQKELAQQLALSLSTVHQSLGPLRRMGAVEVTPRGLTITDPFKILYHWASIRNVQKDLIYQTRVEVPVRSIESSMPAGTVFGAYTAYKFTFNDVPADYSEVYVYGVAEEVQRRFPPKLGVPNLLVLQMDGAQRYGEKTSLAQTFVDLWNLKEWYAREFLLALEKRLRGMM